SRSRRHDSTAERPGSYVPPPRPTDVAGPGPISRPVAPRAGNEAVVGAEVHADIDRMAAAIAGNGLGQRTAEPAEESLPPGSSTRPLHACDASAWGRQTSAAPGRGGREHGRPFFPPALAGEAFLRFGLASRSAS